MSGVVTGCCQPSSSTLACLMFLDSTAMGACSTGLVPATRVVALSGSMVTCMMSLSNRTHSMPSCQWRCFITWTRAHRSPRFAQLVRPGGAVVVVGLAGNEWFDIPLAALAVAARQTLGLVYGRWDHSAPEVWPPPLTYGEMKALSVHVLPGVRYRRHLLGRYSLVWRKPHRHAATA